MDGCESSGVVVVGTDGYGIELTTDQVSCLRFNGEKSQLIVKGAAGSGKSVVLMSKAIKLLKSYELGMRNGIAIFTYTKSLASYAKEFLDPNDQYKGFLHICTLDSYVSEICKAMRGQPDYPRGQTISQANRESLIGKILDSRSSSNHRFYHFKESDREKNIKFWISEFEWMMGRGIPADEGGEEEYQNIRRKGRGSTKRMGSEDRIEAFSLYVEYVNRLRKGKYVERLEWISFLNRHKSEIPDEFRFEHVMVDEAQDLPIISMHLAISLTRTDVLIAMDANQRLYNHYWLMKELGVPVKSRHLKKSFRCTKQIDAFAEALRTVNEGYLDLDDMCEHIMPEDEGPKPIVIGFDDKETEINVLIKIIRHMMEDGRLTIAVILRTRREVYEWSEILASEGIFHNVIIGGYNAWKDDADGNPESKWEYETRSPGLKVCTIHSAKGLEFHNVIIPHFNSRRYPPSSRKAEVGSSPDELLMEYRNLSYVAMTRARANLIVSFFDKPSTYLDDIIDSAGNGIDDVDAEPQLFTYVQYGDEEDLKQFADATFEFSGHRIRCGAPSSTPTMVNRREISFGTEAISKGYNESRDSGLFELYLSRAESGDVGAMRDVAECYEGGKGVAQSRKDAALWYSHCSEHGDVECMLRYARYLLDGTYVELDVPKAIELLRIAGLAGIDEACRILGKMYYEGRAVLPDVVLSAEWYARSAERGDPESQIVLAKMYKQGAGPISSNPELYRKWISAASRGGDAGAQYEYGLYLSEHGDSEGALQLFKESADGGNDSAQLELHYRYCNGTGADKDDAASMMWLKKAVSGKNPLAEYRMYEVLRDGLLGEEADTGRAMRYLRKAADHGCDKAIEELDHINEAKDEVDVGVAPSPVIGTVQWSGTDAAVLAMQRLGFEICDSRPKGGWAWVIDGPGVREYIGSIVNAPPIVYTERGSRGTGHRPAWYIKEM